MKLVGMSEMDRQEVIKRTGLFGPRPELMWIKMGWTPSLSRPDPFSWRDKVVFSSKPRRSRPRD